MVEATALTVDAWALLPNHARLLLRKGQRPLARWMRALLSTLPLLIIFVAFQDKFMSSVVIGAIKE